MDKQISKQPHLTISEYLQDLVSGYYHSATDKVIPKDIKLLCVSFYGLYIINQHCKLQNISNKNNPNILNIPLEYDVSSEAAPIQLVTTFPINKVQLKDGINIHISNEEFEVIAINDYYASVPDELDLKTNNYYTIMGISPSGWWYAVNKDGEDGWIPSNYVQRSNDVVAIGLVTNDIGFINNNHYSNGVMDDVYAPFRTNNIGYSYVWCKHDNTFQYIQNGKTKQSNKISSKNQLKGNSASMRIKIDYGENKIVCFTNNYSKGDKFNFDGLQANNFYFAMHAVCLSDVKLKYKVTIQ